MAARDGVRVWLELRGYLASLAGPGGRRGDGEFCQPTATGGPDSLRRQNSLSVEVGAGSTVRNLLASLAIRPSEVGLVVVNGRAAEPDRQLREGDRILVWPLVAGG